VILKALQVPSLKSGHFRQPSHSLHCLLLRHSLHQVQNSAITLLHATFLFTNDFVRLYAKKLKSIFTLAQDIFCQKSRGLAL